MQSYKLGKCYEENTPNAKTETVGQGNLTEDLSGELTFNYYDICTLQLPTGWRAGEADPHNEGRSCSSVCALGQECDSKDCSGE